MLAIPIINGNNGDQYMSANWDKAKQAAQDVLKNSQMMDRPLMLLKLQNLKV